MGQALRQIVCKSLTTKISKLSKPTLSIVAVSDIRHQLPISLLFSNKSSWSVLWHSQGLLFKGSHLQGTGVREVRQEAQTMTILSRMGKPKRSEGLAERSVSEVELQTKDRRVLEMVRGFSFAPSFEPSY